MDFTHFRRVSFGTAFFVSLLGITIVDAAYLGRANAAQLEDHQQRHSMKGEKQLASARKHIVNQSYDKAISDLSNIIDKPGDFRPIDVAVAYQFRGYAHLATGTQKNQALSDLRAAIEHPALPNAKKHESIARISQLYASTGLYSEARRYLNIWQQWSGPKPREYYRLSALINVMLDDQQPAYDDVLQSFHKLQENYPGNIMARIQTILQAEGNTRLNLFQGFMNELASATPIVTKPTPSRNADPEYPNKAGRFKLEGYVLVGFDIKTDGNVQNVQILEAVPENIFEKDVLKAVKKWKFEQKVIGGIAVPQEDIVYQIVFNLMDLGRNRTAREFRISATWHDCSPNSVSPHFCPR